MGWKLYRCYKCGTITKWKRTMLWPGRIYCKECWKDATKPSRIRKAYIESTRKAQDTTP